MRRRSFRNECAYAALDQTEFSHLPRPFWTEANLPTDLEAGREQVATRHVMGFLVPEMRARALRAVAGGKWFPGRYPGYLWGNIVAQKSRVIIMVNELLRPESR
jgi:hypothetical protein